MKKRPFHETIIDAINRCGGPSDGEIIKIFQLIKETEILEGHDEIIAAIHKYFNFSGSEKWAKEINKVVESILEQKRIVEDIDQNVDDSVKRANELFKKAQKASLEASTFFVKVFDHHIIAPEDRINLYLLALKSAIHVDDTDLVFKILTKIT